MAEATPIRPDIKPAVDLERELLAYCHEKIIEHSRDYDTPHTIAVVLSSEAGYTTHCWTMREPPYDRSSIAGAAAAMLLKQAMED